MLELQLVQLPLQWPVPLLSWCGVPVHVGSDWAMAGLPWMLSLHHLPLMSLLPQSSSSLPLPSSSGLARPQVVVLPPMVRLPLLQPRASPQSG
jgi:hypothetical protein